MTPEEALATFGSRWQEFSHSPDFRRRMELAKEIAIADAEAAE